MEHIYKKITISDLTTHTMGLMPYIPYNVNVGNNFIKPSTGSIVGNWGGFPANFKINGKVVNYTNLIRNYNQLRKIVSSGVKLMKVKGTSFFTTKFTEIDDEYQYKPYNIDNFSCNEHGLYYAKNLEPTIEDNYIILLNNYNKFTKLGGYDTKKMAEKYIGILNIPISVRGNKVPSKMYFSQVTPWYKWLVKNKNIKDCCTRREYENRGGDGLLNYLRNNLTPPSMPEDDKLVVPTFDIQLLLSENYKDNGILSPIDESIEYDHSMDSTSNESDGFDAISKLGTLRSRRRKFDNSGNTLPYIDGYSIPYKKGELFNSNLYKEELKDGEIKKTYIADSVVDITYYKTDSEGQKVKTSNSGESEYCEIEYVLGGEFSNQEEPTPTGECTKLEVSRTDMIFTTSEETQSFNIDTNQNCEWKIKVVETEGDYLKLFYKGEEFTGDTISGYSAVGGIEEFVIESTTQWNILSDSDWVKINPVGGVDDGTFKLTIDKNKARTMGEYEPERTCLIRIRYGENFDNSKNFSITQKQGYLFCSVEEIIEQPYSGCNGSFTISASSDWEIFIPSEMKGWFETNPITGASGITEVMYTISPNTGVTTIMRDDTFIIENNIDTIKIGVQQSYQDNYFESYIGKKIGDIIDFSDIYLNNTDKTGDTLYIKICQPDGQGNMVDINDTNNSVEWEFDGFYSGDTKISGYCKTTISGINSNPIKVINTEKGPATGKLQYKLTKYKKGGESSQNLEGFYSISPTIYISNDVIYVASGWTGIGVEDPQIWFKEHDLNFYNEMGWLDISGRTAEGIPTSGEAKLHIYTSIPEGWSYDVEYGPYLGVKIYNDIEDTIELELQNNNVYYLLNGKISKGDDNIISASTYNIYGDNNDITNKIKDDCSFNSVGLSKDSKTRILNIAQSAVTSYDEVILKLTFTNGIEKKFTIKPLQQPKTQDEEIIIRKTKFTNESSFKKVYITSNVDWYTQMSYYTGWTETVSGDIRTNNTALISVGDYYFTSSNKKEFNSASTAKTATLQVLPTSQDEIRKAKDYIHITGTSTTQKDLYWRKAQYEDWCSVVPSNGKGDLETVLQVNANNCDERYAKMTIMASGYDWDSKIMVLTADTYIRQEGKISDGGTTGGTEPGYVSGMTPLTIVQDGKVFIQNPTASTMNFKPERSYGEIAVNASGPWIISATTNNNKQWFNVYPKRGYDSDTIIVTVNDNSGATDNSGKIFCIAQNYEGEKPTQTAITISQEVESFNIAYFQGNNSNVVTEGDSYKVTMPCYSDSVMFKIKSNRRWRIHDNQMFGTFWCQNIISENKDTDSDKSDSKYLTIFTQDNKDKDKRNTTFYIKRLPEDTIKYTIYIEQAKDDTPSPTISQPKVYFGGASMTSPKDQTLNLEFSWEKVGGANAYDLYFDKTTDKPTTKICENYTGTNYIYKLSGVTSVVSGKTSQGNTTIYTITATTSNLKLNEAYTFGVVAKSSMGSDRGEGRFDVNPYEINYDAKLETKTFEVQTNVSGLTWSASSAETGVIIDPLEMVEYTTINQPQVYKATPINEYQTIKWYVDSDYANNISLINTGTTACTATYTKYVSDDIKCKLNCETYSGSTKIEDGYVVLSLKKEDTSKAVIKIWKWVTGNTSNPVFNEITDGKMYLQQKGTFLDSKEMIYFTCNKSGVSGKTCNCTCPTGIESYSNRFVNYPIDKIEGTPTSAPNAYFRVDKNENFVPGTGETQQVAKCTFIYSNEKTSVVDFYFDSIVTTASTMTVPKGSGVIYIKSKKVGNSATNYKVTGVTVSGSESSKVTSAIKTKQLIDNTWVTAATLTFKDDYSGSALDVTIGYDNGFSYKLQFEAVVNIEVDLRLFIPGMPEDIPINFIPYTTGYTYLEVYGKSSVPDKWYCKSHNSNNNTLSAYTNDTIFLPEDYKFLKRGFYNYSGFNGLESVFTFNFLHKDDSSKQYTVTKTLKPYVSLSGSEDGTVYGCLNDKSATTIYNAYYKCYNGYNNDITEQCVKAIKFYANKLNYNQNITLYEISDEDLPDDKEIYLKCYMSNGFNDKIQIRG